MYRFLGVVVTTWVWIGLGGAVTVETVQWLIDYFELATLRSRA